MRPPRMTLLALTATAVLASACGASADPGADPAADPAANDSAGEPAAVGGAADEPVTLTLLTHDSFNLSEDVLAAFTEQTGTLVEVLRAGDAGAVINQAILTRGQPLGDVLFGVDNVSLQLALDADILAPHPTALPADVDASLDLDPGHRAIPIDHGDVCLNYDRAAFTDVALPGGLDDLRSPAMASRLVVENPATSSPGLLFLLATIAEFGPDGWQGFWADLRAGGVEITQGWEEAYYGSFSGGSGEGDRPLVVSYASSPPAEVLYGPDPDALEAPTGTILSTCYQQVEFAGTLTGTAHPAEAAAFVDFLLSDEVQADIPLQMFVFPVRDVPLPEVFTRHAEVATDPFHLDPAFVAEHREEWVEAWTDVMLR